MSEELAKLANEACRNIRKAWGMFGQVSVGFLRVDTDEVTLEVSTHSANWRGASELPERVRTSLVRFFRDLLPCPIARIVYTNAADGVEADVRFLPFYSEALLASDEPTSPIMLIEENCAIRREEVRAKFTEAWKNLTRS